MQDLYSFFSDNVYIPFSPLTTRPREIETLLHILAE